ncbi:MAG: enoyl-CoA hydratase/isomerase family protein, partial [Rhodobacteraceae bacterium]|nr:enoyl-CoA hydratase/isomerase family protein [Paracoccaceae bacterium]
ELALLGDFIIACERAVFADTHARVGITPSWGLTQVLPRLIGLNRARQMSLTGEFVEARRAYDWGLVNEIVPAGTAPERAMALAHQIAETDQTTMGRIRGLIRDGAGLPFEQAMALEAKVFRQHIAQVQGAALDANREKVTARGRAQSQTQEE